MITERIVRSFGAPSNENDLWLDLKDGSLKHFESGEWIPIAGGSGDGGQKIAPNVELVPGEEYEALESLDIDGKVYKVQSLEVMIIDGTIATDEQSTSGTPEFIFTPSDNTISIIDVYNYYRDGGVVRFKIAQSTIVDITFASRFELGDNIVCMLTALAAIEGPTIIYWSETSEKSSVL